MRHLLLLILFLLASPAFAQVEGALAPESGEPLEITADETLEWHRNEQTFIARTNAVATQGAVSLKASTLTAKYRESEASDMEIWQVVAEGDVVITSRENRAYGDHAVYDLDNGTAELTGDDLKLISPDQTVTAKEKFEYQIADGRLVATGDAKVTRGTDTLQADRITAVFTENEKGERILQALEAENNVIITTPEEVLTGSRGTYRADTNIAQVSGSVKIRRGPNVLEGDKAQVDLTTNVSTMFGGTGTITGSDGRVRGTFYPGSDKKDEKEHEGTAAEPQ